MLDRLAQQAIQQVLQEDWDTNFSPYSYGFRPKRSAHHALFQAKQYIRKGYDWIVDIDLSKFFDRVNHDRLMSTLAQYTDDKEVLRLIRRGHGRRRTVKIDSRDSGRRPSITRII